MRKAQPSSPPVTPAPIGVVGVTQGRSPAILSDNNILQAEIDTLGKHKVGDRTTLDDARALNVGVEGVSKSGHGIVGLAFTGDLTTPLNIPPFLGGTIPSETGRVTTSGVAGLSVKGPGILGVSKVDRGGLFMSATSAYTATGQGQGGPVAQIRLFPHSMSTAEAPSNLPKNGKVGDLLVTQDPASRFCTLWLCVPDSPSTWAPVLLGPQVVAK